MAAASSTATSPDSIQFQNSSFYQEDFVQDVKDLKKHKRMMSNRESARRSRLRKKSLMNNLLAEIKQLKEDNNQMIEAMSLSNQLYMNMEAENSILRAQMAELHHRLLPLKDVIDVMISSSGYGACEINPLDHNNVNVMNNIGGHFPLNVPFGPFYMHQPTMVAPSMFM